MVEWQPHSWTFHLPELGLPGFRDCPRERNRLSCWPGGADGDHGQQSRLPHNPLPRAPLRPLLGGHRFAWLWLQCGADDRRGALRSRQAHRLHGWRCMWNGDALRFAGRWHSVHVRGDHSGFLAIGGHSSCFRGHNRLRALVASIVEFVWDHNEGLRGLRVEPRTATVELEGRSVFHHPRHLHRPIQRVPHSRLLGGGRLQAGRHRCAPEGAKLRKGCGRSPLCRALRYRVRLRGARGEVPGVAG
mmetsp:Transcript_50894/g.142425  ORF Transcript_50894/g.142425 Transcript_50894/m.142425 type:complete len:245 (+) Transcript_50894:507-1241(+)